MPVKTLLPDEYANEITNANNGWQGFTMTNITIQLNEEDRIDEVSALPTPWARMQFVDMAFKKWQGNNNNENELTFEEKRIINYTFDLLELIFFQNFYEIDLEFKQIPDFNPDNYFARATVTFFEFPKPTLIKVKNEVGNLILLGSTSPYTLVYPAYHYISDSYPMGETRKLFDKDSSEIILFGKRPKQFLAYLKLLGETLPIDEDHPTRYFKTALNTLDYTVEGVGDLENTSIDNSDLIIEFKNAQIHQIKKLKSDYTFNSLFFYKMNKIIIGEHHKGGINYLTDFPLKLLTSYKNISQLKRSVLPNTLIKQNWLHESDFFTPKLVRLPYDLNGDSFYIGVTDRTKNKLYAPPLSDAYFEETSHWDENSSPSFETSLKIEDDNLKTRVSVQINLQNNSTVKISRLYDFAEINNDISKSIFALKVFPNFHISNYSEYKETIGKLPYFVSIYDESGEPTLPIKTTSTYFSIDNNPIKESALHVRKKKTYSNIIDALFNYQINEIPRRIKILMEIGASKDKYEYNFLPKFESKKYNEFASAGVRIGFDFGTTNSAIAYTYLGANNNIEIADFNELNENTSYFPGTQFPLLKESYAQIFSKFSCEPSGYNKIFRSVINYATGITSFTDWINFNVYLNPEIPNPDNIQNEIRTEFKWDINNARYKTQAEEWVAHFISSNLFLLKYLLLQKEGNINLKDLELIWFFPLAFDEAQRATIREIWRGQIVFPELKNCQEMDESIAPFINSNFYSSTNTTKVLNIDIGGGTTDVCMLKGSETKLKLSLPLAGRNILGDLYSETNNPLFHNALVWSNVKPPIEVSKKKKSSHEYFIIQNAQNKKKILENSTPVIFFFAYSILKYIKLVLDINISDNSLHTQNYPDIIRFSGNGSKIFESILSNEGGVNYLKLLANKKHSFNKLAQLIFNKEIGIEYSSNLKEDTVRGGVKYLVDRHINENIEKTSVQYEILGENIDTISYSDKLTSIYYLQKGIEISSVKGSFLLTEFLSEFAELLQKEALLFETLFLTDGEAKRLRSLTYINSLIKGKDFTKLQNYIAGGINDSGVSISKLKSSLLMYELQGIINEMTREV